MSFPLNEADSLNLKSNEDALSFQDQLFAYH